VRRITVLWLQFLYPMNVHGQPSAAQYDRIKKKRGWIRLDHENPQVSYTEIIVHEKQCHNEEGQNRSVKIGHNILGHTRFDDSVNQSKVQALKWLRYDPMLRENTDVGWAEGSAIDCVTATVFRDHRRGRE